MKFGQLFITCLLAVHLAPLHARNSQQAFSQGRVVGAENALMPCKEHPTVENRILSDRLESAEPLVIRWVETRTPAEMEIYPHIVALTYQVIGEAFSSRVISPGVTTREDVRWYIRERFGELQLPIWFQPDVDLRRRGCFRQSAALARV